MPLDIQQHLSTLGISTTIPSLFISPPQIRDTLITESSQTQDATVKECEPFLAEPKGDLNVHGISQLARAKHVKYLKMMLRGPYPAAFVAVDASRPWMLYWTLAGLCLLGEDVEEFRER